MRTRLLRLASLGLLALAAAACSAPRSVQASAPPLEPDLDGTGPGFAVEGAAHGFPALRERSGKTLADGEFTQWLEGEQLHVKIRYTFGPDHWIEERSVLQQVPNLVQERWSWVDVRAGAVHRKFEIDFLAGKATAEKAGEEGSKLWSEDVDVEPGRAFAGSAWALALRAHRTRLMAGEKVELQTVGFTPKPQAAAVELSYEGLEQLPLAGRTLTGEHYRIRALVPWLVKAFVEVPDSHIWLASPPPAAFLRWEGPLAEPGDDLVRVDLLPGEPSEPASRAPR
jgi:hypothetical protein